MSMHEEETREKVEKGWLRVRAFVEVMAIKEDAATKALEKHVEKIEDQDGIEVYKKEFDEPELVDNPPTKKANKAYSQIVEIEFVVSSVKNLMTFSMIYGPSSVEIIEPNSVEIKVDELQDMANSAAALIHQYASQGAGGIVTSPD
ncbi:MAG: hypothetical protein ACLFQ8_00630 [Candidatus Aenigmatarchaeota archaeon]